MHKQTAKHVERKTNEWGTLHRDQRERTGGAARWQVAHTNEQQLRARPRARQRPSCTHTPGAAPPLEPRPHVRTADDCTFAIEQCPTLDPLPLRWHSTRCRPVRWRRASATIGCIVPSSRLQGAASSVRSARPRSSRQHRLLQNSRVHLQRRCLAQKNNLYGPSASTDIR